MTFRWMSFSPMLVVVLLPTSFSTSIDQGPWPDVTSFDEAKIVPEVPTAAFLSRTLGDHMVLQCAPQAAVVWGHTKPGATVFTEFAGQTLISTADPAGTWRQRLPPTPAAKTAYTLNFKSDSGETATLRDVLFGDVYICGGQSNMQFAVGDAENATQEAQLAANYPQIRLFTVGQGTQSKVPLADLQTVEQKWSVASPTTVSNKQAFSYFSAVCWFFGKSLADALGEDVPLGLISNNWGGTAVELWSTPEVYANCNSTGGYGSLYNAMINPYVVGPMAVTGFTWYQGESNTRDDAAAATYSCRFPAMISAWRRAFQQPSAYFGFVQLSTWCDNPEGIAAMREAQMKALLLPKVGYATNADHGAGCNIHPPVKQYCALRLARSALALQYGRALQWRSPTFQSAQASLVAGIITVAVTLADVSPEGLKLVPRAFNWVQGLDCAALEAKRKGTCAWASIELATGQDFNATAMVDPTDAKKLLLKAAVPTGVSAAQVTSTSYGWGAVPLLTVYDASQDLPVLPWRCPIKTAPSDAAASILI